MIRHYFYLVLFFNAGSIKKNFYNKTIAIYRLRSRIKTEAGGIGEIFCTVFAKISNFGNGIIMWGGVDRVTDATPPKAYWSSLKIATSTLLEQRAKLNSI